MKNEPNEILARQMKKNGVSQAALARHIEVDPATLWRYLNFGVWLAIPMPKHEKLVAKAYKFVGLEKK